MSTSAFKHNWILLIHQLPPKPTNLRVRVWRKLQKLGAVSIKNSVYVLPFSDKTHEDFQWLKQEVESMGGEATVFRAGSVEGATDGEIIDLFRKHRDEEYAQVAAELDGLAGAIREQERGGHLSSGRVSTYEVELDKLHKELERILSIDFFDARNRSTATSAYERCQAALRNSQADRNSLRAVTPDVKTADVSQYQGRRWVTRRNLFVDRLAAVWLIKRFIDKRPRFSFVSDGEVVDGAIGFDMYGGEFSHRGEDCTFETMIKEFGLARDPGLRCLAEVVHDIDLKDNKFNRTEAQGLSVILRGLSSLLRDDRKLIQQTLPVFDALYEALTEPPSKKQREGKDGRRSSGRKPGRGKQSGRK